MSHIWYDFGVFFAGIGWPAAVCLFLGMGLLIFEMFTPGFHAPGLAGIVLVILGIVLVASKSLEQALILLLAILVILGAVFILALHSASKGRLYRSPLVLKTEQKSTDGYLSVSDMKYLVGRRGVAATMLRPAGTGDFDGVRLDVVTESEFMAKGTPIEITAVQGRRIVVRSATSSL